MQLSTLIVIYMNVSINLEVVCEWEYWLFHWMAHTTCSAGNHCVSDHYFTHPSNWSHLVETTVNQGTQKSS